MKQVLVYNPQSDSIGSFRGSGRIMQILKENCSDAVEYVSDLQQVKIDSTLFIPSWSPFQPPRLTKRYASRQIIMIFDVIPLKYPTHFPAGLRGNFNVWRNKRALKYFDKIITISEHSKKDIVRYLGVPEEKVAVVYPAVSKVFLKNVVIANEVKQSQDEIAASSTTPRNDLPSSYCLYVGDVNWNKNLVNLAKAIKKGDTPCVFVGKMFHPPAGGSSFKLQDLSHPWQQEFKQFLAEVGDDKRFIFAGYVPDEELVKIYQKAICNVLISRDEGFGYSYAEAASQHCPSVLSDADIFHETAAETALFADPENPEDIAEKIREIVSNPTLRKDLAAKAYERTIKMYSSDSFFRQFESVFVQ